MTRIATVHVSRLARPATLVLALLAFALAAPSAAAATTLKVTGHDAGGDYWFEVEGLSGRNPKITLAPNEEVTVTFENVGEQVHNLHFGAPVEKQTAILEPGKSATLNFTVPASASSANQYWCDPHRALGMEGPLAFASPGGQQPTGGTPDGDDDNGLPGFGAVATVLAVAVGVLFVRSRPRSK